MRREGKDTLRYVREERRSHRGCSGGRNSEVTLSRASSWLGSLGAQLLSQLLEHSGWQDGIFAPAESADFAYRRFYGDDYGGSYSPQALAATARKVKAELSRGRDVYAYFNNDRDGHAVRNALDLRRYVTGRET